MIGNTERVIKLSKITFYVALCTFACIGSGCAQEATPDTGTIESRLVGSWAATVTGDNKTIPDALASAVVQDFSYTLTITDYAPTPDDPKSELGAVINGHVDFTDNAAGLEAKALYSQSPTAQVPNISTCPNMSISEYGATGSAIWSDLLTTQKIPGVKIQPDEIDHNLIYVSWPQIGPGGIYGIKVVPFRRQ